MESKRFLLEVVFKEPYGSDFIYSRRSYVVASKSAALASLKALELDSSILISSAIIKICDVVETIILKEEQIPIDY